jgi:hypothetical protein
MKRKIGGFMKIRQSLFIALVVLTFALGLVADDAPVGITANQQGNVVYFSAYNNTGSTVCVFPNVVERTNVNGSVVPMTEVPAGATNSIGAFAQADPNQAWSVDVSAKYHSGGCAE